MKRFYGSAVFEGVEVTDKALTKLLDIRAEEARRVEYHQTEFRMQIDELNYWRTDEINAINSEAARLINDQYAQIDHCYNEISRIQNNLFNDIEYARVRSFLTYHVHGTQAENDEIARLEAQAASAIRHQYDLIRQHYRRIDEIKIDQVYKIYIVERDYEIEYNIRLTRMEKDIAWSHSDATAQIEVVLSRLYKEPVYMLRNAKGPCEFCRAKYGTTGIRAQLEKIQCIPPFHDDCRCWIEQIGYTIMSR